jgi:hypothetical protein
MQREAVELAFDLETDARHRCAAVIAAAGEMFKAAKDRLYAERDAKFDALRERRSHLKHTRPRTDAIDAELTAIERQMRDWRTSPPDVDLAEAEASREAAVRAADNRLAEELRRIFHDRLRAGELY